MNKNVELLDDVRKSSFQHGWACGVSLAALTALLAVVIARVTNLI